MTYRDKTSYLELVINERFLTKSPSMKSEN